MLKANISEIKTYVWYKNNSIERPSTALKEKAPLYVYEAGLTKNQQNRKEGYILLLLSWPTIREVCPNYKVMMFQPQIGTSPDLWSVSNCYVSMLLSPDCHFWPLPNVRPEGKPAPAPSLSPLSTVLSPHRIICAPGRPLSLSHHTKIPLSVIQTPLPPPIPLPLPRFSDSCCCAFSATKISSNVTLSCFRAAVWRHHGSWQLPTNS